MKKIFSIIGLIKTLFFVFFFFSNLLQAQDWIKNYPGIPIETELWWGWTDTTRFPGAIDSMREAGINIIRAEVSESGLNNEMKLLRDNQFVIIPTRSLGYNWIAHYTDAKYSIWEAEGNSNYDANLIHYDSVMAVDNSGTYLKLRSERAGDADTLIKGPYYIQDVHYYSSQNGKQDTIIYTANFKLKLEPNTLIPDTIIQTDNPTDTICIIQVTQSYASTSGGVWHLPCTYVIEDSVLTRGINFDTLNVWKDISLRYTLECDSCRDAPVPTQPPIQSRFSFSTNTATDPPPRFSSQYIQFKVLWKKNPNYLISIDKVIISDDRGLLLKSTSIPEDQILIQQVASLDSYQPLVTGWLGVDEPVSIDIFEPIKMVTEILDDNSSEARPLYLPWMGMWDGVWENRANPFGAMGKSHWSEFKKRVGRSNIIQDFYMYDYPYLNNGNPCYCSDFRVENIWRMCELNYKQAYQLDPNFGVSLQCGEIHFTSQAEERNNTATEFLYNANLALMYGAKFFSLYTYFAQSSQDSCYTSGLTCHAIVDFYNKPNGDISLIYTEKYNTLRYKLNPRLKGSMGKTLKTSTPSTQHLNINPSVNSDLNLNYIKRIKLDYGNPTEAMPSFVDLGFFSKEGFEPNRYFMIINRYYTDSLLNKFKIDFRNLSGFYNWSLMNYVDSSNTTIIANETGFVTSPQFQINRGDAILFSLFPVAEFGGKLLVSENVGDGMTLIDDMSIENGATLTINGTYNAKANITVKSGGKIVAGTNGKIIFDPGKNLTVAGSTEIKGTSTTNKITLEFSSLTSNGVVVKPGASLIMSYCNVTNAQTGITAEVGAGLINISYTNLTGCSSTGIALLGGSLVQGASTPPVPTIYRCNVSGASTGILVQSYREAVIKENTINNTNLGINISYVSSSHIIRNTILGKAPSPNPSTLPGLLISHCGGYLRSNTIKYHLHGVQIAHSLIEMELNTITENNYNGLYISAGAIPDLRIRVLNPGCWIMVSGRNTIMNNGRSGGPPPVGAGQQLNGSEIYINNGDIILEGGRNEIKDDRQNIPSILTYLLIDGSRTQDNPIYAQCNYWGTTPPTASRFGSFDVVFEPTAEFCPLPDAPCYLPGIIIQTTDGTVIDTIYSGLATTESITDLEAAYAMADKLFLSGQIEEAIIIYAQIVQGNFSIKEKLEAYTKLYEAGNLTGKESSYFASLQSDFNGIANTASDTLIQNIYNQNAILCDISNEEYITAINKYDNIIQQNPNSEEAVYAEIDILTTALKLDTTNSQLGKMGNGKYLVKGTSDYLSKLNDILQSKFGINSEEKEQIIPKEYSLYQNYPNPFNPATTIKFDIPNDGLITLEIFDILGRKIAALLDEYKTAGSYEQLFIASALASGVYVYKLQAGSFINSKKMLLIK